MKTLSTGDAAPPIDLLNAPLLCDLDDPIYHLSGADARTFLQGQVTCDIRQITDDQGAFGAVCTAKGRTVSLFFASEQGQQQPEPPSLKLHLPKETAPTFVNHLTKYMVFSKATLARSDDQMVKGLFVPDGHATGIELPKRSLGCLTHGKLTIMRMHETLPLFFVYGDEAAFQQWSPPWSDLRRSTDADAWLDLEIYFGLPRLSDDLIEAFVPQALNLVTLNAISFSKGCYTGQEIIARIKYLGKEKKQLALYAATATCTASLQSGQALLSKTGQKVGTLLGFTRTVDTPYCLGVVNAVSEERDLDNIQVEGNGLHTFSRVPIPYEKNS